MDWSELESRQPRLAVVARERLLAPGVLLVHGIVTSRDVRTESSRCAAVRWTSSR